MIPKNTLWMIINGSITLSTWLTDASTCISGKENEDDFA